MNKWIIGGGIFLLLVILYGVFSWATYDKVEKSTNPETVLLSDENVKEIVQGEVDKYCNVLLEEKAQNTNPASNMATCGVPIYNITQMGENFDVKVYQGLSYSGGHKGSVTLSAVIDKEGNLLDKDF